MTYHVPCILSDSHGFCSVITHSRISSQMSHNLLFLSRILLLITQFYFIEHMETFYNLLEDYFQAKNEKLIYHYYIIYYIYIYHFYFTTEFSQVIFKNRLLKPVESHFLQSSNLQSSYFCGPPGRWIGKCWEVCVWSNFTVLLIYNSPRNIYVQTFGFPFVKLCSNTIISFSK